MHRHGTCGISNGQLFYSSYVEALSTCLEESSLKLNITKNNVLWWENQHAESLETACQSPRVIQRPLQIHNPVQSGHFHSPAYQAQLFSVNLHLLPCIVLCSSVSTL